MKKMWMLAPVVIGAVLAGCSSGGDREDSAIRAQFSEASRAITGEDATAIMGLISEEFLQDGHTKTDVQAELPGYLDRYDDVRVFYRIDRIVREEDEGLVTVRGHVEGFENTDTGRKPFRYPATGDTTMDLRVCKDYGIWVFYGNQWTLPHAIQQALESVAGQSSAPERRNTSRRLGTLPY